MNSPASNSDETLNAAARSLRNVRFAPIGTKSQALRRAHFWGKLSKATMAVGAVLIGAGIIGGIIGGIGFWGVMITALLVATAAYVLMRFPQMPMPTTESLKLTDLGTLAGKTEIWLEAQRPALPAPAVTLMQDIGVRLDQLAPQLQTLDDNDPAAREVRKLVGEHLPELINGYKRIPESLRNKEHAGKTPAQQLVDGLKTIDREIETMTGQISRGELDKLAVRGRYLEIRYDGADKDSSAL
ncbi:MAG: hypothetical protein ACK4ZE_11460 [Sphingorhabdus sp.]